MTVLIVQIAKRIRSGRRETTIGEQWEVLTKRMRPTQRVLIELIVAHCAQRTATGKHVACILDPRRVDWILSQIEFGRVRLVTEQTGHRSMHRFFRCITCDRFLWCQWPWSGVWIAVAICSVQRTTIGRFDRTAGDQVDRRECLVAQTVHRGVRLWTARVSIVFAAKLEKTPFTWWAKRPKISLSNEMVLL